MPKLILAGGIKMPNEIPGQTSEVAKTAEKSLSNDSHSIPIGYVYWVFGFTGAHRFYYGKPISGTIYFFTLGLLGVGWIVDLFLIPAMDAQADRRFKKGQYDYNLAWIFLTFLGIFGVHRFYLGKYATGIIYFFTGGFFLIGLLYDMWTLNQQVNDANSIA